MATQENPLIDLPDHPQRHSLSNEVHARPFMVLVPPERVSHLALVWEDGGEADREQLEALCRRFNAAGPRSTENHFVADLGPFRLKWERHTEFSTYTFMVHGPFAAPFADPVISRIPADWIESLRGKVMVAAHAAVESGTAPSGGIEEVARRFTSNPVAGSRVLAGGAEVWTDFRVHADGFGRFLVRDIGLRERQAGRLTQRLLEIETYRVMALLALPPARTAGQVVARVDRDLAQITGSMAGIEGLDQERQLLNRLTLLAAEVEGLSAANNYRFGAARAYYALVNQRIAELREARIEGVPTIGEFMERRLAPAMDTCKSVALRQEGLSARITRASQLLRTRVDIALEGQNRDLLRSMNRRAQLQLRLQETVEGLSVVVVSYYAVSLAAYVLKAVKAMGVEVNVDIATGFAIPVVLGLVWAGVRRVRKAIMRSPDATP
ncbi:MAG: DUF3422 domain-containing protein [Betaproteobacteria bacterium]|nr:DUF3422 domain-containing protein [Betaproteobacteria bacterium]